MVDDEERSSEDAGPTKHRKITNQYANVNEPLDVLMGGSNALLQIVHTLVGSLSRLDNSVETLFSRLDNLEDSVETLTFNIQGFEPDKTSKRKKGSHHGSRERSDSDAFSPRSPMSEEEEPPTPKADVSSEEEPLSPATEKEPVEPKPKPPAWNTLQGIAREHAAASLLQNLYRGHRERKSGGALLKKVKMLNMTSKKIPKTLTLANRIERVEQKCSDLEGENKKLLREMNNVREEAKEAVRQVEEKSERALKGVTRLDHAFVELRDHVHEALLEQSQRTDGLDSALQAFQDEVASGFESQGSLIDGLKKEMAYIQSPEGQAALKDGLIEMEMGGVLASVLELKNVIAAASPLPRQDAEVVKKLAKCSAQCTAVLTKAQAVEEEEMAELLAQNQGGEAPSQDAWLGALNEPEFMNMLVELLWSAHLTLKEDALQREILEGGDGPPDTFVLEHINVYVESLNDVLGDLGACICNVLEHFLNKGRQQIAIRELWGSLSSIKSDVLRDVSVAVQNEMDKKANQEDFAALMKRSDAGLRDTIKMKPEVELWSLNKEKLMGLDIDHFNELSGRVDESFTSMFAIQQLIGGKVGRDDMDSILQSLQAQFSELEERHAAGTDEFEKMLEPKVDRTELAKLARALASKGEKDDPILAFYTEKPQFSCLSCNRPLPKIPNSVDLESAPRKAAPEVFEGRPSSGGSPHGNVLVPSYEKPLAKVRPPPKQRTLHPGEEHRYALDVAKSPEPGIGVGGGGGGGGGKGGGGGGGGRGGGELVPGNGPISRYERNVPSNPSRMNTSGGVNLN